MARDLTSGFISEIDARLLRPIVLFKAEFDSGDVNMWTGYGTLTYDGDDYLGVGNFLGMEGVTETNEIKATSARFKLNGVDSGLLSLSLLENYQGRPVTAFFGVMDENRALIDDPFKIFSGRMDIIEVTDSGDTAEIVLIAESDLIDLRVVRARYLTPEDQKQDYPNDKFFNNMPKIADTTITWGMPSK
jgi:hypothetical protein